MHFARRCVANYAILPHVGPNGAGDVHVTLRVSMHIHNKVKQASVAPVLSSALNQYLGGIFRIAGHLIRVRWSLRWESPLRVDAAVLRIYLVPSAYLSGADVGGLWGLYNVNREGPGEDRFQLSAIILAEDRFLPSADRKTKQRFGRAAAHEVGHSLGLKDTIRPDSIMFRAMLPLRYRQRVRDTEMSQVLRSVIPESDQPQWLKFRAR